MQVVWWMPMSWYHAPKEEKRREKEGEKTRETKGGKRGEGKRDGVRGGGSELVWSHSQAFTPSSFERLRLRVWS